VSERRVCRVLDPSRTSLRYAPMRRSGRVGVGIAGGGRGLVSTACMAIGSGLKVPSKPPKRRQSWLNDGSCIRLRPEYPNRVWSYNFVTWQMSNGRPFKILAILDEYRRECLALLVARKITADEVRAQIEELFIPPGSPRENGYVESFNGRLKLFLKGDIFDPLPEAQILIEPWRGPYHTVRPHRSRGDRPPAPETAITLLPSPLRSDDRREV